MKKSINLCLAVVLLQLTFISCQKDDNIEGGSTEEVANEAVTILTGASQKTWRISEATLLNGNAVVDITENFNVQDDEFVFKGSGLDGTLIWKQGYAIATNATTTEEALLDNYVSIITDSFSLKNGSDNIFSSNLNNATFKINEDQTVSAKITNPDATEFEFTLVEKKQSDYVYAPQQVLSFENAFTFNSVGILGHAPGMIGSYSDNSFFIVTREGLTSSDPDNIIYGPERVIKFDIASNQVTESLFHQEDYVSKQLHIIDNKLIAIGGQFVNTYDLDLSTEPESVAHGKERTRFGMAVLDTDAYIVGGDLHGPESNKIFKWNLESETLSEFATLPEDKFGARATIVADYLYVFGGRSDFVNADGTNTVYKIDINNPNDIETFTIGNNIMEASFVQKHQHLIYVAGTDSGYNAQTSTWTDEFFIGVFNTLDGSFEEIPTNLTSISGRDTIHQMCVFNDKIYVLYGDGRTDSGEESSEWEILVADLN